MAPRFWRRLCAVIVTLPARWRHCLAYDRYPNLVRQMDLLDISQDRLVVLGDRLRVKPESLGFLSAYSHLRPKYRWELAKGFWLLLPYPAIEGQEIKDFPTMDDLQVNHLEKWLAS